MGIKTIVDLRREAAQARAEQEVAEALGMKFLSVPMEMGAPTDEQISRVMQELSESGWYAAGHWYAEICSEVRIARLINSWR